MATGKTMVCGYLAACLLVAAAPAMAENSVVVDVATGKVLSDKNASQRWYPASTTKLMTAYVALKAIEDKSAAPDTPVVMTRYAAGQEPSKMGFAPGSVMRLDTALRMMLVKSANDVAVAIGEAIGHGSLPDFVTMMNAEAKALGMADTVFVNPNGLPQPGQHSSAKDLALLAVKIRTEFPAYANLFGTEAISTGAATIRNTNSLLGRFDGADGMKTGYICASGFNLVASATRNGRTLVAVVLGASGPIVRDREIADILEEGFKTDPATKPTLLSALPVGGGEVADISQEICSPAGAKGRADERQADAARPEHDSGSPYLHEMNRQRTVVRVALGGAAGAAGIEPGITRIAAYGIPVPVPRPDPNSADVPASPVPPAADASAAPGPGAPQTKFSPPVAQQGAPTGADGEGTN